MERYICEQEVLSSHLWDTMHCVTSVNSPAFSLIFLEISAFLQEWLIFPTVDLCSML